MPTQQSKQSSAASSSIYQKILAVQTKIDAVPKRGFNAFHKYHYATEADILTVKETLNANGLIVLPTTLHEQTGFKPDGKSWASVTLLFRVVDVQSGESIESQFTGYAEDNFDKAIYKATTGANKYFYLKFFGIATEDDPEREDHPPAGRPAYAGANGGSGLKTFTVNKPAAEKPTPSNAARPVSGQTKENSAQKKEALEQANKILALQKQHGLSNEEILRFGEIDSIKTLAEAGDIDMLNAAYQKLTQHISLLKA